MSDWSSDVCSSALNISAARLQQLMAELVALASGYDLVLLDLGAGLERTVRQMAGLARTKLIVATDEPTSLTDAYAFIKLAHMQDPQVGTGGPDLDRTRAV